MKKLSIAVRLLCAATAVGVTLALLGATLSIAGPQHDILIARAGHVEQAATASVAVAMATAGTATLRR